MPTDQKYASMVRRFRQPAILTLAIGFTLAEIGCGGGSSSNSNVGQPPPPPPITQTTATQVKMGDAPADRVTSFEVTVGPITMTPSSGSAVTILSGTRRLELTHLSGTNEPLALLDVPQGSYSSASMTVSSPEVTFINNRPGGIDLGLQILSLPLLFRLAFAGTNALNWAWTVVLYFGLITFLIVALYSILLDRDFKTLKHAPFAALLIIPLSYFYSFVVLSSVWKELLGRAESWEKIERLPSGVVGRRGGVSLVLMGVLLVGVVGDVRISHDGTSVSPPVPHAPVPLKPASEVVWAHDRRIHDIAIATHFDGWQDWRNAITSVLQNPVSPRLHTIGVSAGRVEWAHFQRQGHQAQWSALQKKASVDMLGEAIRDFKKRGLRTVAMVDFYSLIL